MVMIPMECPKCGRRGSVPSNRLNTLFRCKNCQAPFYLNSSGDVLAGEPPMASGDRQSDTAVKEKAKKKKTREFDVNLNLAERWKEMTPKERNRVLLSAGAVLVLFGGLFYYFNSGTSDPLTERAIYVARAYADNDLSRIQSLAAEGTSDQLAKWFNETRSQSGIQGGSSKYSISAGIMEGSAKSGSARLTATFSPLYNVEITADTQVDPRAAAFKGDSVNKAADLVMPTIDLRFQTDSGGNWRLDGRTMLDEVQNQQRAKTSKPRSG